MEEWKAAAGHLARVWVKLDRDGLIVTGRDDDEDEHTRFLESIARNAVSVIKRLSAKDMEGR